eukprot:1158515-Pelagomonas_calceolata.AAC.1
MPSCGHTQGKDTGSIFQLFPLAQTANEMQAFQHLQLQSSFNDSTHLVFQLCKLALVVRNRYHQPVFHLLQVRALLAHHVTQQLIFQALVEVGRIVRT